MFTCLLLKELQRNHQCKKTRFQEQRLIKPNRQSRIPKAPPSNHYLLQKFKCKSSLKQFQLILGRLISLQKLKINQNKIQPQNNKSIKSLALRLLRQPLLMSTNLQWETLLKLNKKRKKNSPKILKVNKAKSLRKKLDLMFLQPLKKTSRLSLNLLKLLKK